MKLSELTSYAQERYQIREEFKWEGFPGFSVLADPDTGKWVALLMRQWDSRLGEQIERCDLKCGREALSPQRASFLSPPFRMHGDKWAGVSFNETTQADVVFHLLDKALRRPSGQGALFVLEGAAPRQEGAAGSTLILPDGVHPASAAGNVPSRIREMLQSYEYGDGSFRQKCLNFFRQGSLMADYEDNVPWNREFIHYFPTYHDLNIPQLRGYFTWRTELRHGLFLRAPASFAYLYLYELLSGIGVQTVEERLQKLEAFEAGYLDAGLGDERMRENLHRWMFDLAVLHSLPRETARRYAPPEVLRHDTMLGVLRSPDGYGDGEIYAALCALSGKKEDFTPVVRNRGDEGKHLFALAWKAAGIFETCFGKPRWYKWYPLSNAVYYDPHPHPDADCPLDDCREFRCRDGVWHEKRLEPLFFDRKKLLQFLRAADRQFRKYCKTGGTLAAKAEEEWVLPFAGAAVEADRAEKREAARPKISIDLSALGRIREDALSTRDSLLTEEEKREDAESAPAPVREMEPLDTQVLRLLLAGTDPGALIREQHLMPSILADSINEVFFEETGDNVVDTDGKELFLIEDYREELEKLLNNNHGR